MPRRYTRPADGLARKDWWADAVLKTRDSHGLLQPRWIHKNRLVANHLKAELAEERYRATDVKTVVVSFRLTRDDETALRERLAEMGVDSTRKLCRKIVVDYLDGKMECRDPVTGETCPLP